jgi:hypothetical protein
MADWKGWLGNNSNKFVSRLAADALPTARPPVSISQNTITIVITRKDDAKFYREWYAFFTTPTQMCVRALETYVTGETSVSREKSCSIPLKVFSCFSVLIFIILCIISWCKHHQELMLYSVFPSTYLCWLTNRKCERGVVLRIERGDLSLKGLLIIKIK